MPSVWQQLGGFVNSGRDLSDDTLSKFSACGGRWIIPLLSQLGFPDDHDPAVQWNVANIESLKARAKDHQIATGGWFNGWGHDPETDATHVAQVVKDHGLVMAMLDLELAYQYPNGDASLMPRLVKALRTKLPTTNICVSTNGLNSSMIWNGRNLTPAQSFYDLGVRVAPQWYNSPAYGQGTWMTPHLNMKWLKDNAGVDPNFRDPNAPIVSYRGVPLSYVHGTLEVTGLENSDLAGELASMMLAQKQYGYTTGLSLYLLENTPASDFDLLAKARGKLFLV